MQPVIALCEYKGTAINSIATRIAVYVEDSSGNNDGEIIGLKLDKYYNARNLDAVNRPRTAFL